MIPDHKCLIFCDTVTSLPYVLGKKMRSVAVLKIDFKGNVVKAKKKESVVQENRNNSG